MNSLGLEVSSVGNHEFDEGVTELKRLQYGGCHPVDGCQDGDGFARREVPPTWPPTRSTRRPGCRSCRRSTIKFVGGVPVGFVGLTLEGTAGIVNPAGIKHGRLPRRDRRPPTSRPTCSSCSASRRMVLLVHEGGAQAGRRPTPGRLRLHQLHRPDRADRGRPQPGVRPGRLRPHPPLLHLRAAQLVRRTSVVTSAGTNGQLVTDIDFTLDRRTRSSPPSRPTT